MRRTVDRTGQTSPVIDPAREVVDLTRPAVIWLRLKRRAVACSGVAAVVAVLIATACASAGGRSLEASARCHGTAVQLRFDPQGGIEFRTSGKRIAWADAADRHIDFSLCKKTRTQRAFHKPGRYTYTRNASKLSCRVPTRFFVHVHPVYTASGGEGSPSGSAVYLILGSRHALIASATVENDSSQSSLAYSPGFCVQA